MTNFDPPIPLSGEKDSGDKVTKKNQCRFNNYVKMMLAFGYKLPKTKHKKEPGRPFRGYVVKNAIDAAIAVLHRHPTWSIARVAKEIGCSREYLQKSPVIQMVDRARIYDRSDLDGFKDPDTGDMETWSYKHDIRNSTTRRKNLKPDPDEEDS